VIQLSGNVEEVADDLITEVSTSVQRAALPQSIFIYELTPRGDKVASALWSKLTPVEQKLIQETKNEMNELPLRELLLRVYKAHPKMRSKSKILWQLGFGMGSRPDLEPLEHED